MRQPGATASKKGNMADLVGDDDGDKADKAVSDIKGRRKKNLTQDDMVFLQVRKHHSNNLIPAGNHHEYDFSPGHWSR